MGEVRFGGYLLERLLGKGGMGQVWLAHDAEASRWVALKLLPTELADDMRYRRRFEREAEIVAQLRDPHIPRIHRFGEIGGRLFIDMEFIEGDDLSGKLVAVDAMTPGAAVSIVGQVAAALDVAHRSGLVHRDVKPSNIVVHPSGFTYLIDFGIAHGVGHATVTTTGLAIGTLAYMAPERFAGKADARSDVYSLACVLYECLTGTRPYGDTDPAQQMHAHLMTDPPRARPVNAEVSADLDAVIARGMAKDPDERYSTAGDFAAAALRAIGGSVSPPPARPVATVRAAPTPPAPTKVMPEPGPTPTLVETRIEVPFAPYSNPAVPRYNSPAVRRHVASPVDRNFGQPGIVVPQSVPPMPGMSHGAVVPYGYPVARRPGMVPRSRPGARYGRRVFPNSAKHPVYPLYSGRGPFVPIWRPKRKRGGALSKAVGLLIVICVAPFLLVAGCVALVASGTRVGAPGGGPPTLPPLVQAEENPALSPNQPQPGPATAAPADIPVRDGKFEFVVTDVETGVPQVGFQSATGSFLIVTLAVRNISEEPKRFLPFGQRMVDASGRPFDHNATATMWQVTQHRYGYTFDLGPGRSATTQLVFDVPPGATPAQLELHDFVLSNGVTVRLD